MDYEKKYKEGLEGIEEILSSGQDSIKMSRLKLRLQGIFPELKESEDERIRKALLDTLPKHGYLPQTNIKVEDAIAWLEKQGQTFELQHNQDEQNPADKVEPTFNKDEWITNGAYTWQIVEVKPLDYILQSQDGNIVDDTISYVDEEFYLWTIEDATDGDVLVHNGHTFIFMGIKNGIVKAIDEDFNPYLENYGDPEKDNDYYPATKAQRDLFFQKMKEAGYEWDSEKKELIAKV